MLRLAVGLVQGHCKSIEQRIAIGSVVGLELGYLRFHGTVLLDGNRKVANSKVRKQLKAEGSVVTCNPRAGWHVHRVGGGVHPRVVRP